MTIDNSFLRTQRHGTRPLSTSLADPGTQLADDQVWDQLSQFGRWGWTLVAYGDRVQPDRLVAYQRLGDHVDVLIIDTEDRCAAYRALAWPDQDPVEVDTVTWCYLGRLADVVRNLLALPTVDRSWPAYPLPSEVPLPDRSRRLMTIRPPQ